MRLCVHFADLAGIRNPGVQQTELSDSRTGILVQANG